jgi:hypothetical protein
LLTARVASLAAPVSTAHLSKVPCGPPRLPIPRPDPDSTSLLTTDRCYPPPPFVGCASGPPGWPEGNTGLTALGGLVRDLGLGEIRRRRGACRAPSWGSGEGRSARAVLGCSIGLDLLESSVLNTTRTYNAEPRPASAAGTLPDVRGPLAGACRHYVVPCCRLRMDFDD